MPEVVDCDRVGVYLWDAAHAEIVRRATSHRDEAAAAPETDAWSRAPSPGRPLERLLRDAGPEPMFVDADTGDPLLRELFAGLGAVASILVPLATPDSLLGLLSVSVMQGRDRLVPNPDLLDLLSGVAAQASTALQNGHLVDQITHQALHDELTGLANRLQFADDLRAAVNRARQQSELVTLLYIDLDGFKPVNDEFGHEAGDELLIAVGQRLTSCTRAGDTVARLGGDEFAVLIGAHRAPEDARVLAERLKDSFTRPFSIRGREIRLGASIGRAAYPTDAGTADSLLRVADAAMFDAKREQRTTAPAPVAGR